MRNLQASFQRHLGISPLAFLRQTRLHRVRARLLAADPAMSTVAQIASAFGFNYLGRFSAYYAEQFGEYPSDTMRRRRLI